jgi:hypothetical protein
VLQKYTPHQLMDSGTAIGGIQRILKNRMIRASQQKIPGYVEVFDILVFKSFFKDIPLWKVG